MSKQAIFTETAPKPVSGVYNQAIVANGVVYCSGQVPLDPATGKIIDGDIQAHTVSFLNGECACTLKKDKHQCLKNLGQVLKAAGSSLEKAVEVNVFLDDMDNFAKMNEVYFQYFGHVKPARTFVLDLGFCYRSADK